MHNTLQLISVRLSCYIYCTHAWPRRCGQVHWQPVLESQQHVPCQCKLHSLRQHSFLCCHWPQSSLILQLAGADTVTGPSADPATAPADAGHAPSLQAMQNEAFSFDLSSGAGTGGPAGDEYSLAGVQDSAGSPAFSVNYQAQVRLPTNLQHGMSSCMMTVVSISHTAALRLGLSSSSCE